MNRIYRVVWSAVRRERVVVGELAKGRGKGKQGPASVFRRRVATLLLASGLGLNALPASAGVVNWGNPGPGNWYTTINWDGGSVPTSTDSAVIDNGGTAQIGSGSAEADRLYLGYGSTNNNSLAIGSASPSAQESTLTTAGDAYLGTYAGDTGAIYLVGPIAGATLNVGNKLYVGDAGTGSLNVEYGDVNITSTSYIGDESGSVGTVTLTSSTLTGTSLYLGRSGSGTLTIGPDSQVNLSGTFNIAYNNGSVGTLDIGASAGASAALPGVLNASSIALAGGTGTIVFNHTDPAYDFDPDIYDSNGNGDIYLYAGTTSLNGNVDGYYGDITVEGGTLSIDSSDRVTDGLGQIGVAASSDGTVLVDGGVWGNYESEGEFIVGGEGSGTLNISNGGQVHVYNQGDGVIAQSAGSVGLVAVDGSGSQWGVEGTLFVGGEGYATLDVTNGGTVANTANAYIAANNGSSSVLVDGSGSSWTSGGDLSVGDGGAGTLTIRNGGSVTADGGSTLHVGSTADATGILNIGAAAGENAVGAGTLNAGAVAFDTGFGTGLGKLVFNHTDAAYEFTAGVTGNGRIEHHAGVTTLSGDSSGFAGWLDVHHGTVRIAGAVSSQTSEIAGLGSDNGTVIVDGASASWSNGGTLYVGEEGEGHLSVTNGGTVSSNTGYVAYAEGSVGVAEVSGAGSSWTVNNDLSVGGYDGPGVGSLTIGDGASVSSGWSYLGHDSSTGSARVTGENSSWTVNGKLHIGERGSGELTLGEGASVEVTGGNIVAIGEVSGSSGILNIGAPAGDPAVAAGAMNADTVAFGDGDGALVFNHTDSAYDFSAGINGAGRVELYSGTTSLNGDMSGFSSNIVVEGGTLSVDGGDAVVSGGGLVGDGSGSNGTVLVDGGDWTSSGPVLVGINGAGFLSLANGGTVSTNYAEMGRFSDGGGTVVVDGNGSAWASASEVTVGSRGAGSLTIRNAGSVDVDSGSGTVTIAKFSGATGALNIGAAAGDPAGAAGSISADAIAFGAGTGTLLFNHTDSDYTFPLAVSGAGAVALRSGSTRFSGALTGHTGTLAVDGGTLSVGAADTLNLGGDYTQSAAGTLHVGLDDETTYGRLVVSGTATLDAGATVHVAVGPAFPSSAAGRWEVLGAGALVGGGALVVTDDSEAVDFEAVVEGNSVYLEIAPIDAACGAAAGVATLLAPTEQLCEAGTPGAVTSADGTHGWSCAGSHGGADAACSTPGASAGGTDGGDVTLALTAGEGCAVASAVLGTPPEGGPPGVDMPYGTVDFALTGCTGGSATLEVTHSGSVEGMVYWKYINEAWTEMPATLSGNTATFTLEDNGPFDADPAVGSIVDPGGVGSVPTAVPTLSQWATLLLGGLMALVGWGRLRRTGRLRA